MCRLLSPPRALLILACSFLLSSCFGRELKTSTKGGNQKQLAIDAASKVLVANGYEGFRPTGEIHRQDDSQSDPGYEIIFSDGLSVVEVDVASRGIAPVEIEEDIELEGIPESVKKVAVNTGQDVSSCVHYQKAAKLDAGNEVWFEFEECSDGMVDVEVREEDLRVAIENDDNTIRGGFRN